MNTRKVLSVACHASVWLNSLVFSVGVPIAIMLLSDDPVVKANAKEALNIHLNLFVAYITFGILCWVMIGIPFLAAAGLYNLIMPLVAICAVAANPDSPYRYPFCVHVLDSRKDRLLPPTRS